MAETMQIFKIKCPHCGFIRPWKIRVDGGKAEIVMGGGLSGALKDLSHKIQTLWSDPAVAEAAAWIDLPACPHCDQPYQYNLRTGAAR